jgi:molecular chaperone DnaJ
MPNPLAVPGAGKNHYDVLGVKRNATTLEIKEAYRRLVKVWHPDVNKAPDALQCFKNIQLAHRILTDRIERADYDAELESQEASGRPRNAIDKMMDAFSIFGSEPTRKKPKQKRQRQTAGPKSNVFISEIPPGFGGDDSMGGIV